MKVQVGDKVAFNMLPDATWFRVMAIDGFRMLVKEDGADYAPQQIDKSLVKQVGAAPKGKLVSKVSVEQAMNGKLW